MADTNTTDKAPVAAKPRITGEQVAPYLPAITVLLALAYGVGGYMLIIRPQLGSLVTGGKYDFTELKARVVEDEQYADKLTASLKTYQALSETQRGRVQAMLPLVDDYPNLLVQLEQVASDNGMLLMSFDTSADVKNVLPGGRVPIRIAAQFMGGSNEQFMSFIDDIQRSLRVIDIKSVSFTPDESYSVTLVAYMLDAGNSVAK